MAKMLLKELGMLGLVLGLTVEAPAFAQDSRSEAEASDPSSSVMKEGGDGDSPVEGEGTPKAQDDSDTEGGMVKEEKAGFGSGGEAMPGTELPDPPREKEKDAGK